MGPLVVLWDHTTKWDLKRDRTSKQVPKTPIRPAILLHWKKYFMLVYHRNSDCSFFFLIVSNLLIVSNQSKVSTLCKIFFKDSKNFTHSHQKQPTWPSERHRGKGHNRREVPSPHCSTLPPPHNSHRKRSHPQQNPDPLHLPQSCNKLETNLVYNSFGLH